MTIHSKSVEKQCPIIKKSVKLRVNYASKGDFESKGRYEDCDSTKICGVSQGGNYEWSKCPFHQKEHVF